MCTEEESGINDGGAEIHGYFFFRGRPLAVFGCVGTRPPPGLNGAAFFPLNAFLDMAYLPFMGVL
jgi:hypothetical protein